MYVRAGIWYGEMAADPRVVGLGHGRLGRRRGMGGRRRAVTEPAQPMRSAGGTRCPPLPIPHPPAHVVLRPNLAPFGVRQVHQKRRGTRCLRPAPFPPGLRRAAKNGCWRPATMAGRGGSRMQVPRARPDAGARR